MFRYLFKPLSYLNPFVPNAHFLYPLKISENSKVGKELFRRVIIFLLEMADNLNQLWVAVEVFNSRNFRSIKKMLLLPRNHQYQKQNSFTTTINFLFMFKTFLNQSFRLRP